MPRVLCPHCRAGLEVETPASGSAEAGVCASCGGSFSIPGGAAAGGATRRLVGPPAAESTLLCRPAAAAPGVPRGIPQRLGPYQVLEMIGAGGMGVVYRGYDPRLNRNVALKTLKPELSLDPEYRERFLREARSAAALSHPNVTQIYFIGEEEGQPFFAMEFLEGKSLETLVREQGKLPPGRAAEMIRQAASGLRAAAARGIIHRDIKPSNLALTSDGALKVTDFGLAKVAAGDAGLTLAGEVMGSPNYMAPEQASGHPADLRSDIYSLGATLYELVTGRPPFEGPTPVSVILKHAREPVKNPRQLTPGLPYPLVILIQKMLAKRPEDRPQTYDALLRELDRPGAGATAELGKAPIGGGLPDRPATPPPSPSSRSWILAPVLILALLGVWGLLRQLQASGGGGGPSAEAGGPPATPATGVLSSTTDVSPPELGPRRPRRAGFSVSPRLESFREASRADLQFVTNTHEITADGRLRVMGSVVNAGMGRASEVRIRILLIDSAGRKLDSAEVALAPPLLGPRQTGTFEATFPDPAQMVSIRTELNWNS